MYFYCFKCRSIGNVCKGSCSRCKTCYTSCNNCILSDVAACSDCNKYFCRFICCYFCSECKKAYCKNCRPNPKFCKGCSKYLCKGCQKYHFCCKEKCEIFIKKIKRTKVFLIKSCDD